MREEEGQIIDLGHAVASSSGHGYQDALAAAEVCTELLQMELRAVELTHWTQQKPVRVLFSNPTSATESLNLKRRIV